MLVRSICNLNPLQLPYAISGWRKFRVDCIVTPICTGTW
jgi:hypothetical protein